jgi:hypothetical protein
MPPQGKIKAVFFGAPADGNASCGNVLMCLWTVWPSSRRVRQGDASAAVRADLDDTLLPTTAADAKALQDVAALLADSHPDVQWDAVHAAWKTAFGKAPWDAQHKVRHRHWHSQLYQHQHKFGHNRTLNRECAALSAGQAVQMAA